MARIRTIKPEFFRHLELFQTEIETGLPLRVAYAGLWTVADREGRFRWQPDVLKLDVLPFDNLDFSRVLDALLTRGFIVRYEVCGKSYGLIPTFTEHQIINNRERGSFLPSPPKPIDIYDDRHVHDACATREPRHLNPAQGERELEKEQEREKEGEREQGTFCAEPKKIGSALCKKPAVISIPLICKKNEPQIEFDIYQPMIDDWAESYPAVNVTQELHNIRQWNIANPTRRKTKSGILRHINTWLADKQNKGGTVRKEGIDGKFKAIVSTGDPRLDVSITNAANFVKRRMERASNEK
jgi:hypothetical protein